MMPSEADDLRALIPQVIGILVRRGADFVSAEDAVQEALVDAIRTWDDDPPRDRKGWLVTAGWRRFLDATRSESARRDREDLVDAEPTSGPVTGTDETLSLYFLCAHPSLSSASAVALTLRAVGGLTTAQIARAYLVPEATMAQRISRAKRTISGERLQRPADVAHVLRVLYLVFTEGYSGEIDLSEEAIRLTRQVRALVDHPEVTGLLALMVLVHARRPARISSDGALVPLDAQDRSRWSESLIVEGVGLIQHAAVEAHLRERAGETDEAARCFVVAAERATSVPERDHLRRQAARLNTLGG